MAFKKETLLEIDNFNSAKKMSELASMALNVRNLLLMEKGTVRGCFDMGCELLKYRFDLMSDTFVSDLTNIITYQINTFLEEVPVSSVLLSVDKETKKLNIDLFLSEAVDGKTEISYRMEKAINEDSRLDIFI